MAIWTPTTAINSDPRPAFYPKRSFHFAAMAEVLSQEYKSVHSIEGFHDGCCRKRTLRFSLRIAWLGGTPRLMSAEARVGFHAAYSNKTGQETGVGNALVGAYLNKIGLPYSAVIYISQAAPNSMTWLSIADAEKQGIDVEPLNSGQIVHTPSHEQISQSPSARKNGPFSEAEKVAIHRQCADQANARSLHGYERWAFRAECKKRFGL
jgi:hypothetical protein